jgi:hypothetical protein
MRIGEFPRRACGLVVLNPVNNGAFSTIGFAGRELMDD